MIKVLIADDQKLMAEGLKTIIDLEHDIEVVGVAKNGIEAINEFKLKSPNVILMDVRMPKLNGVEATKSINRLNSEVKILILTTFDEDEYIVEALANGACGYMLKDIDGDELINSIRQAYNNQYILPSNIAQKLAKKIHNKGKNKRVIDDLTDRECEVAEMLSQGFNNKQIASALFLSEGTIKNIVSAIYSKINISDRVAAAIYLKKFFTKK